MGLDLWFREDVSRILAATHETMRASMGALPALDPELTDTYRRGFSDALKSVAIAFGVAPTNEPVSALPVRSVRFVDVENAHGSGIRGDHTRRNGNRS